MTNSADALRRWLATFCLATASGMLIWGQTVLQPHMGGTVFLAYWAVCLSFAVASIIMAVLDARAMLRNMKVQRTTLAKRSRQELEPQTESQQCKFSSSTRGE